MPQLALTGAEGIALLVAVALWTGMLITFKKAVLSRRHIVRLVVLLTFVAALVVIVAFVNAQSSIVSLAGIILPIIWGFVDSLLQLPDSARDKKRVVIALKANTAYNRAIAQSIEDSLKVRLPNSELKVFFSSQRGENMNDQVAGLRRELAEKPDAVVIVPSPNNAPVAKLAAKAIQDGIGVITVDDQLDQSEFTSAKVFPPVLIATDFEAGGRLAARTMLKALGGRGNVVIISGPLDSLPSQQRKLAFIDEILLAKQSVLLVAARETSWNANEGGHQIVEMLRAGEKIDGVFCCNDNLAIGVLNALKQFLPVASDVAKYTIVGFDGTSEIEPFILQREIYASVDVGTKAQGAAVVDELAQFFKDRRQYLRRPHPALLTKPSALTHDILATQGTHMR